MKKILSAAAVSLASLTFAASEQTIVYDTKYSPLMGAEDILTAHSALMRLEDFLLETPGAERKPFLAPIGRLLELSFFWNPLNDFLVTVQHEIFGHGYRIRDLDPITKVKKYKFDWPFPYGKGGASTSSLFYSPYMNSQLFTAVTIGGVEATGILADRMIFRWIESNQMDGRQSSLYQSAQHDITNYILSISNNFDCSELSGHDMEDYITILALTYPGSKLSKRKLKRASLINFADPFTFYSIWSAFKYIYNGKTSSVPMIPLGKVGYLPSFRLGLTPFGPEIFFNNYFRYEKSPIHFYARYGKYFRNQYYGAGLEFPKLIQTTGLSFGFKIDLWRQPSILFRPGEKLCEGISYGYPSKALYNKKYGGSLSFIMRQAIYKDLITFFEQVGWKTNGYLPGESLDKGPIARVGVSGTF